MAKKAKEATFEEALEELESIISEMENSEPSLDELTQKYGRGIELSRKCMQALDNAEAVMDLLVKDTSDGVKEEALTVS